MPVLIESNSVSIRRARDADKEAIWLIRFRAIQEVSRPYYTPLEIHHWSGSITPEYYAHTMERHELIVAEYGGKVIGFGQLDREHGFIEAVYVSPDYLRRGIGMKLLETLEQKALDRGCIMLQLCSSLNALPFYERAGYKAEMNVRLRLSNGFEIPCIYMTKKLAAASEAGSCGYSPPISL